MKTKQCYEKHTNCNKNYCEKDTQHTPTPWKVSRVENGITTIREDNGECRLFSIVDVLKPEDAAFIVKAVNSHEIAKETLYYCLKIAQSWCKDTNPVGDLKRGESMEYDASCTMEDKIRKAIIEMEGNLTSAEGK